MLKRRPWLNSVVFALALLAVIFLLYIRHRDTNILPFDSGRKTVADRLEQFGPAVTQRLSPYFQSAGVPYPPNEIILVALKDQKILQLWASGPVSPFKLIRTYPILAASGRLGPKLKEGDRQVPEGIYKVESLNPNSSYHLSLRLNYPNDFDRLYAKRDGRTNLGGDIMLHGSNASIGCLAMGDTAAEELFILAAKTGIEKITVILTPVDFRTTQLPELTNPLPNWTNELYQQIKQKLSTLNTQ